MSTDKDRYITRAVGQLAGIIELPEGFRQSLNALCRVQTASKMSYLEYPGEAEDGHLWYLVRGIVRSIAYDAYMEEEHTLYLWRKDDVLLNTSSFINDAERENALQALDDSVLLHLPYPQLRQLTNEWPELISLVHRLGMQREQRLLQQIRWLHYPAAERVRALLLLHPGIDKRVQHSILADYLCLGRSNFNVLLQQIRQDS